MIKVLNQYFKVRSAFFFLLDGFLIFISVPLAIYIRFQIDRHFELTDRYVVPKALLFTLICQICLLYNDLYTLRKIAYKKELAKQFIQAIGAAGAIVTGISFFFPDTLIGRGVFLTSLVICPIFLISWRHIYSLCLENSFLNEQVIIIGSGSLAKEIRNEINTNKSLGYQVVAFIDESPTEETEFKMDSRYPKSEPDSSQLSRIVREKRVSQIIVALSEKRGMLPVHELLNLKIQGIEIHDGISFFEKVTGKVDLDDLKPSWLIYSDGFKINHMTKVVKRFVDLGLSSVGLMMSVPFFLFIPVLLKLDSPGPVFFRQARVGENGRVFTLIKFRSMRMDAESASGPIWAQKDDPRVTRLGRLMRKTRIDEIPQLYNVLKGEMSFVGPRPERPAFVEKLNHEVPYFPLRHSVKPGLTGWAQIKYPYGASVRDSFEKLKYDLYYLKNVSFYLDFAIIFSTIKVVLSARGGR